MWRALLTALQFLTILPVPRQAPAADHLLGRSLLCYPLVGALLGGVLITVAAITQHTPPSLSAAIVLALWVILTGALHLDGLADTADAWVGGLHDRDKTLAIMKDPCCGPVGVMALIVIALLKWAALAVLLADAQWAALIAAPVLGRTLAVTLLATTPYARPGGLGEQMARHLPRHQAALIITLTLVIILFILPERHLALTLTTALTFWLTRTTLMRRLHGTTGDTTGALIELTETTTLLTLAI